MTDPENIKAIIRLRPPLQIVQPLDSSASSPHYVPRQPRLYHQHASIDSFLDSPSPHYTLQPENASIYAGGTWFTFDGVHPPSTSTAEIYQSHIASMIQDAVSGYNSTLFAYGATGSGKSFSMMGTEKEDGIMQRAIEDVFDLIEQDQEREYVVRVSYLEIYNEQLGDLLANERVTPHSANPLNSQHLPKVHEDRQGRIFVRPLVSTPCGDSEDVIRLLMMGESRRRTERTEWNLHSSRSHAIFSLTLESRPVIGPSGFPITSSTMRQVTRQSSRNQLRSEPPVFEPPSGHPPDPPPPSSEVFLGTGIGKTPITPSITRFKSSTTSSKSSGNVPDGSIRISQLNLVDLAGSERLTDNEARNKEASYIKKSLLALQSVVSSLTELGTSTSSSSVTIHQNNPKHKLMHIPYRNSQLTRLLQTSLSGNAKVAFLCTISPDPECEVETLSTLRFAAGAKKVQTKAELGQVVDRATLLEALEAKVLELEAALMTNADYTEALERERDEAIERADGAEKICDDYESKLAELQTLRTPLKEQHDHLKRLILTGSPRSSYATHHTLEPGLGGNAATLNRKKSSTKRPSRLSEAATATSLTTTLTSPGKRVGWKELFFDEPYEPHPTSTLQPLQPSDSESQDKGDKLDELTLTIAKLEATLAEAEDTHLGEISESRAEIAELEKKVKELQSTAEEKARSEPDQNSIEALSNLEKELEDVKRNSSDRIKELESELKNQADRMATLESQLTQSRAVQEELRAESERTTREYEDQLALQAQLITILEHKLQPSSSSSLLRPFDAQTIDEDQLRRYSEVTVNGQIDKEEEEAEERVQLESESIPPAPTSNTTTTTGKNTKSRNRSRSKSARTKKVANGSRSCSTSNVDQNLPIDGLDIKPGSSNTDLVQLTDSPTLPSSRTSHDTQSHANGTSRKRTTSQRPISSTIANSQNIQFDGTTPVAITPSSTDRSDCKFHLEVEPGSNAVEKTSEDRQPTQFVRRSARHHSSSKKSLESGRKLIDPRLAGG